MSNTHHVHVELGILLGPEAAAVDEDMGAAPPEEEEDELLAMVC